jgi:tRNA (guanine37-N1)-methyltransferase
MWFSVITLFPETFKVLDSGITGRAKNEGLISLSTWNPRDYTEDKYKSVDDRPYGGGPGMVMMVEPLQKAIQAAKQAATKKPTIIYLSPQGKTFNQSAAEALLAKESLLLIAGRYEGIDERLLELEVDEEWSIGDYVLSGGELAAMVMIDAITRLIPGALGHEDSADKDSLSTGLLKYPQYTRPEDFEGIKVPPVLLSGNHQAIERWRQKESLGRTWLKRPDLLMKANLTQEQLALLIEFVNERQA